MSGSTNKITCGFIGLGSQGAPIARRMIDAGFPMVLWARRAESLYPYRDTPATYAQTIEELGAQVDHVGICVVNDDDVRQITNLLIPVMRKGSCIAIHSTIHPDTCKTIAARAGDYGISLIDAPVSGGSPAAEAGTLTIMIGSDSETFEQARSVFETFGKLIVWVGDVGAGQYVKLINNSVLAANLGIADAALDAGSTLGLDRSSLLQLLLASSGRSFGLEVRARMDTPAGFLHGGDLLRKDVTLLSEVLGSQHPAAVCMEGAAKRFLAQATANTPATD